MQQVKANFNDFLKKLAAQNPGAYQKWQAVTVADYAGGRLVLETDGAEIADYVRGKVDGQLRGMLGLGTVYGVLDVIVREKHAAVEIAPIAPINIEPPAVVKETMKETDWRELYREAVDQLRQTEAALAEAREKIVYLENEVRFEKDWKQVNGMAAATYEPTCHTNEQVIVIDRAELASLLPAMTPRAAQTMFVMLTMVDPSGQLKAEAGEISEMVGYKKQKSWGFLTGGVNEIARIGQGFLVNCPQRSMDEAKLTPAVKIPSHIYIYDDVLKNNSFDIESSSYGQATPPDEVIRLRVKFLEQIGFHWKQNWKRIADKVGLVSAEQWADMERAIYAGTAKGLKNPARMVWDTLNAVPAMAAS